MERGKNLRLITVLVTLWLAGIFFAVLFVRSYWRHHGFIISIIKMDGPVKIEPDGTTMQQNSILSTTVLSADLTNGGVRMELDLHKEKLVREGLTLFVPSRPTLNIRGYNINYYADSGESRYRDYPWAFFLGPGVEPAKFYFRLCGFSFATKQARPAKIVNNKDGKFVGVEMELPDGSSVFNRGTYLTKSAYALSAPLWFPAILLFATPALFLSKLRRGRLVAQLQTDAN